MRISKYILIFFTIIITTSRDFAQLSLCLNTPTFSPLLVAIPVFQKCYADLNNDNQLDFIMPSYGGGGSSITIVFSNGINQYQSYLSYSCSLNPYHVESDDFNNDGNMDVLCVSYDSSKVLILNGNGAGTFTASMKYSVTSNPLNARCKDLNSDGKVDVVVASSNSISVLINNGSGGFLSAVHYPTTLLDPRLILSDFDNDGKTDVFIYHNSNSRILKNLGNGTFQSINTNTYNFNYQANFMDAHQVLSFDLNNDNKMDLIGISVPSISVYYGNGNFTFSGPSMFSSGLSAFHLLSLSKGDINGDGLVDVVSVNFIDTVSIFLNNGSGGFQNPIHYLIPPDFASFVSSGRHVDVCDIDSNGKLDIAIGKDNSGNLSFLYNCSVTEIGELKISNSSFKLFPNPSSGIFHIMPESEVRYVEVTDINGRIIMKNSQNKEIDLSNYYKGIYFLRIESVNGEIGNYKLIKTD